jgi:hypothetical protein
MHFVFFARNWLNLLARLHSRRRCQGPALSTEHLNEIGIRGNLGGLISMATACTFGFGGIVRTEDGGGGAMSRVGSEKIHNSPF